MRGARGRRKLQESGAVGGELQEDGNKLLATSGPQRAVGGGRAACYEGGQGKLRREGQWEESYLRMAVSYWQATGELLAHRFIRRATSLLYHQIHKKFYD